MSSQIFYGTMAVLIAAVAILSSRQDVSQLQQENNLAAKSTREDRKPNRVDDTRLYMRAKLASSQRVMEGLVAENYDLIIDGATQMRDISHASHWPKTVDEVYQHYSVEFRRQCDKLKAQAARSDLQAAHYTYLHLSTTCIDCHNYVRPRFKVRRSKKGGPVQLIPTQWDSKNPPSQDEGSEVEQAPDKTG